MSQKRPRENQSLLKDCDDKNSETPRSKRSRRSPKSSEPRQKASVKTLAVNPTIGKESSTASTALDCGIVDRIKKCLALSNHPGTPEMEAKAAFRMASALMARYNVTQAEVFEQEDEHDKSRLGGESVVTIITSKGDGKVLNYAFTGSLATAMNEFFDCKSFSVARGSSLDWTFYGISSNTAVAAMAFEMAYNLILTWSLSKKGVSVRHSYCLGVAKGLYEIAREEKRVEREKAKEREAARLAEAQKSEQTERQREIDRLNFQAPTTEDESDNSHDSCGSKDSGSKDSNSEDDDSDDAGNDSDNSAEPEDTPFPNPLDHEESAISKDDLAFATAPDFLDRDHETFDPLGDFETELRKARGSATAPPIKTWESETQLIMFRETAQEIAKDYLRQKNIKLRKGRKKTAAKDYAAYKQGKKDSKKVDVRRNRLEAS